MSQPLPHAIIRWQLRHALLAAQRAAARQALDAARTDAERATLAAKLHDIERSLRALGPDPAAKMG